MYPIMGYQSGMQGAMPKPRNSAMLIRNSGRTAVMSQMLLIHTRLRDMVLSLDLGPGERLSERLLEREFNGSRTPVRAALLKLEAEGLVCRDRRNWVVAPIDLGEIAALAEFRLPLEETAVPLACT